jgi:hypothetical protein
VAVVDPNEPRKTARRRRSGWFSLVPLLSIVVVLYAVLALVGVDFARPLISLPLPSGGDWGVSAGEMLLALALVLLFLEILKSTRAGGNSVIDHAMAMIVFIVCLALFLVWSKAATSTFFLIGAIALIDVAVGVSVTFRAAWRDRSAGAEDRTESRSDRGGVESFKDFDNLP